TKSFGTNLSTFDLSTFDLSTFDLSTFDLSTYLSSRRSFYDRFDQRINKTSGNLSPRNRTLSFGRNLKNKRGNGRITYVF
ncbi:hypothetical protein DBV15_03191, partial [Temnothorax longispinosus]